MMGYLSLTIIIDRIICDPIYGASNYGDIRDLMTKMLEMCTYEQILLTKTASLVSSDVYAKLLAYKKLSCKSFAAHDNYCHVCTKPLQPPNLDTVSISNMSIGEQPISILDSSRSSENTGNTSFENKQTDGLNEVGVVIFQCSHTFHENCFETNHRNCVSCPVCNQQSTSINGVVSRSCLPKSTSSPKKVSELKLTEVLSSRSGVGFDIEKPLPSYFNKNIVFTDRQQAALKSIRSRNTKQTNAWDKYKVGGGESVYAPELDIEKKSKLKLAPANLSKFIN